ncbi:MAG: 23S rRNA (pseudouridine(1915)-N(3))-methyltransferase RlmH [Candidatus Solibacter usitatus]|nr:23S rRNA (pseudouridine(1915)-N(3))-methyltransferase RlmH [Candidatus Solibacter usitatus]
MKIHLLYIGKARDKHSNAIAEEFLKRSSRWAQCEMREVDPRRYDLAARHAQARRVLLDPAGKAMDSAAFAALVKQCELDARDLVFVIGGADGLPSEWRSAGDRFLSLSAMTFPHELARAMLAEQIYRALATLRGHPYPR